MARNAQAQSTADRGVQGEDARRFAEIEAVESCGLAVAGGQRRRIVGGLLFCGIFRVGIFRMILFGKSVPAKAILTILAAIVVTALFWTKLLVLPGSSQTPNAGRNAPRVAPQPASSGESPF